jgi:hypothetical protein
MVIEMMKMMIVVTAFHRLYKVDGTSMLRMSETKQEPGQLAPAVLHRG